MKKTLLTIIAVAAMISCTTPAKTNNKLVAYFSATGTTKAVAERIAAAAGADLFEIQPAVSYTDADLNWRDRNSRSSVEMADKTSRPAIAAKIENIAQYDTLYVGFPIWWYTAPTIINTFFEENNFEGKPVKLFATSGGSDIRRSCYDLENSYPNVNWAGGKLLNGPTDEDIADFIKEN